MGKNTIKGSKDIGYRPIFLFIVTVTLTTETETLVIGYNITNNCASLFKIQATVINLQSRHDITFDPKL